MRRGKLLNPVWVRRIAAGLVLLAAALVIALCVRLFQKGKPEVDSDIQVKWENSDTLEVEDLYNGLMTIPKFDAERNTYDLQKFAKENGGRVTYPGAKTGIDVSSHQQEIDWAEVKKSGIDFAMVRVGYRGMTEGGLFEDEFFRRNVQGALDHEIAVGVYFFSQAVSQEEAKAEADFVLDAIREFDIRYPVVFDWELIPVAEDAETPRTDHVKLREIANLADAFCREIEAGGKTAAFYTNKHLGYEAYDLGLLKNYEMWYADYNDKPSFYYQFDMWQYTEAGEVPGINTAVDLNLSFKDYAAG